MAIAYNNNNMTATQVNYLTPKTDVDSINKFLRKHKGNIKNIKQEEFYDQPSFFNMQSSGISDSFYAEKAIRLVAELEMDIECLSNIVKRMEMIDTMMRDPETAELLQQAEFITRLKKGNV